ncbi:MAG: translation initiation factor IF-2 [Brevundimonas subvibrioides]|uniref:Translation initiation factor IF-2 n=1 Tax=Brevundimonas subvibrioides TaxID=74313 RepID=A0A258HGV0_9CAUL|nr:translation initiation factor IF-2 [Brevundimonas subvibrioides]OYX55979.1 MAG: translation initiation factor IF-2 [Brevundimonas subvibrioides]
MSDENDKTNDGQTPQAPTGTPSTTGPRAPLSLKPRAVGSVPTGTVRQSFSHGRTKTVAVEIKRRPGAPVGGHQRPQGFDVARPRSDAPAPQASAPRPQMQQPAGGRLSNEEQEARRRAIETATQAQADRAAAQAAEQARRDAAAREQAAATAAAASAAQAEAAAARAAAEAARAEASKLTAAAPAPTGKPAARAPLAPKPVAAPPPPPPPAPVPVVPVAPVATVAAAPEPAPAAPARPAPPARPVVNFGQRVPKAPNPARAPIDRPAFGARSAREEAMGGGEKSYSDRPANARPTGAPARPAEPVRYSALNPRPAAGAARPGGARTGPGGRPAPNAPPATPDVMRPSRAPGGGFAKPLKPEDDRDKRFSDAGKAVSRTRGEPKRREGRLTIQSVAGDGDTAERMRSLASVRRAREREKEKRKGGSTDAPNRPREVIIPDVITVQELSNRMAVRGVDIIKFLMKQGLMMKINDVIDTDTAELVADEFGMTVRRVSESDVEAGFLSDDIDDEATTPRAPVVAIMGHVDHGKTSLLDALRATDVAAGEAGGITQHIGAYQVKTPNGDAVTFLDTPGHAAFSAMRTRGANVTDIVILVVAADDGVMPQTIESIQHAKAAGAPIIVAVNKIDKPDADPQKVINELLQYEIIGEALGGDTQIVEISAKARTNLDGLLEAILLQAEVMDLKADPERSAEGVVIEAKLDKGRGPVATILVKRGTLRKGDLVVAGSSFGRVRALLNERGEQLTEAGPSVPVEILGLDEAPSPGEPLAVVENEARARELTEYRARIKREKATGGINQVSLVDMMAKLGSKKISELPVLIKSDVQGSGEAIQGSLEKMGNDEVRARVIYSGAGGITESDVQLAKSAGAPILGFNVRASKQAKDLAEREGVEIRYYAIIYDLLDDMKGVLSGMLAPLQRETFLGNAAVLQVFDISKTGKIAGCRVSEGVVRKGAKVRIIRDDIVVLELGTLATLKRFKDEVNEVPSGQECGMHFQGFHDIKVGDYIECFTVEEIQRTL